MDTFKDESIMIIRKIMKQHTLSLAKIYFDPRREVDYFSYDFHRYIRPFLAQKSYHDLYYGSRVVPNNKMNMLDTIKIPAKYEIKRKLFEKKKEVQEKDSRLLGGKNDLFEFPLYRYWYFQFDEAWRLEISKLSSCKSIFEFYENKFRESTKFVDKRFPVNINLKNRIKIGLKTINEKISKSRNDRNNQERSALSFNLFKAFSLGIEASEIIRAEYVEFFDACPYWANEYTHNARSNMLLFYHHVEYVKIIYLLLKFLFEASPAMKDRFKLQIGEDDDFIIEKMSDPFMKSNKQLEKIMCDNKIMSKIQLNTNVNILREIFLRFETQNSQIVRNALATKHYFNKRPWRRMPEKLDELASVENYDKFVRNPIQRLSI